MSYAFEWVATGFLMALAIFMCVPYLVILASFALAVALVAAVVAAPFLLGSFVHRHWHHA